MLFKMWKKRKQKPKEWQPQGSYVVYMSSASLTRTTPFWLYNSPSGDFSIRIGDANYEGGESNEIKSKNHL